MLLNFFHICYKHFIIAGFCIETEISIFSRKRKTSGYLATTGPSFLPSNCGLGLSVSSTEHVLEASWGGGGLWHSCAPLSAPSQVYPPSVPEGGQSVNPVHRYCALRRSKPELPLSPLPGETSSLPSISISLAHIHPSDSTQSQPYLERFP